MTTEAKETPTPAALPKEDWNVPKPEAIPRATYVPAAMAFGLTFFFWGFITSPVVLVVGLGIVALSLAGWVREMRHE
jgi:hypothetical protein